MAIKEVGRVGIRGVPDVRNFRDELKRDLEKVERYYAANPIEIGAEIDSSGLRREAATAAKRASGHTVEFRGEFSNTELDEQIAKIRNDLGRLNVLRINLFDPDGTTGISKQIEDIESSIRRMQGQKIDIDVNPVFHETDLRALGIDLKVNPESERSVQSAIDRIDAELEKFKMIELKATLDEDGLNEVRDQLTAMQDDFRKRPMMLSIDYASPASVDRAIRQIEEHLSEDRAVVVPVDVDTDSLTEFKRALEGAKRTLEGKHLFKVVVDTSDLASVQAAIAAVKAQLAKKHLLKIEVDVDDEGALARHLADLELQEALMKDWESRRPLEIDVDWSDLKSVEAALKQLDSQLMEKRATRIEVGADRASMERARAEIAAFKKGLEDSEPIKLKYDKSSLSSIEKALADLRKREDEIEIDVDVDPASLAKTRAELEALARKRRVADILVRVRDDQVTKQVNDMMQRLNRISGAKVFSDMSNELSRITLNFDDIAIKSTIVSGVVGNLIAVIGSSVGSLAVIGEDLVSILGIAWAAPSFLAATAIQAVVLGAAFKDLGEVLGDLQPAFSDLQDTISENFWAEAEQPIRDLIDKYLPELEEGFANVATSMGENFGIFADSLSENLEGKLTPMFENLNEGIQNSAGGFDALAGVIATLGEVGAEYLPRFGEWFTENMEAFELWLNAAAEDGRLNEWIDNGLEQLGYLGDSLLAIVDIFGGIADAAEAAGHGGLEVLAGGLQNVADRVNSPEFQAGLTEFFEGALEGANALGDGIGNLLDGFGEAGGMFGEIASIAGEALGTIATGIGEVFANPNFQDGVVELFDGLLTAVEGLEPLWGPLGDSIGTIASVFGDWVGVLGEAIGGLSGAGETFDLIIDVVGRVASALTGELGEAIEKILPVISEMVEKLLPGFEEFLMSAVDLIEPLSDILLELLESVGVPLAEHAGDMLETFAELLDVVGVPMMEAFASLIEVLGPFIEEMLPYLLDGFVNFTEAIEDGMPFFEALGEGFRQLSDWLTSVAEGFEPFHEAFGEMTSEVGDLWDALWLSLQAIWVEIFQPMIDGITTGLDTLSQWWSTTTSDIETDWNTFWGEVDRILHEFFDPIVSAIDTSLNNIIGFFSDAQTEVTNWWKDTFGPLEALFSGDWAQVESAVSGGMDDLLQDFRDLPNNIVSALGNLGSLLWNAGSDIMNGFLSGLRNAYGSVQDFIGGIAGWIQANKGPAEYDRKLLVKNGGLIMEGLDQGLRDGFVSVKRSVSGMAGQIQTSFDTDTVAAGTRGAGSNSGVRGGITVTGPLIQVDELVVDSDERVQEVAQALYERGQRVERANGRVSLEGAMV